MKGFFLIEIGFIVLGHKKSIRAYKALSSVSFILGMLIAAPLSHAKSITSSSQSYSATLYKNIKNDPVLLQLFLQDFPKGADLHNHLVGAIYAENFLRWAAEDGVCVEVAKGEIASKKCLPTNSSHLAAEMPATSLIYNETAWNNMIDALSMRHFVATDNDRSGHDHFFATFARFDALSEKHNGDMLAQALSQGARDHVHYIEFMISPELADMIHVGVGMKLSSEEDFDAFDEKLAALMPDIIEKARAQVDQMEEVSDKQLHCGTQSPSPGCFVKKRYLYQSVRIVPPQMVYPQLLAAYMLVKEDSRFVGINIVAPEDDPISMHDYALHMKMFAHLNKKFPNVKLSLHAGELTPSLVGPDGVQDHIWQAVTVANAARIGHGVDILWEHDPQQLLSLMAKKNIMVEINLSSNEKILGIKGKHHPFMLYRQAGVPVALSTDDEGVLRGNLTQEYLHAAQRYPLSYEDLVELSRRSLEGAFIKGESLWVDGHIGVMNASCHKEEARLSAEKLSLSCRQFLDANPKASLEWDLERDFYSFDQKISHNSLFTNFSSSKASVKDLPKNLPKN